MNTKQSLVNSFIVFVFLQFAYEQMSLLCLLSWGVKTSIIIKQEETVTQMVASRVSDEKTRFCQTSCGLCFPTTLLPRQVCLSKLVRPARIDNGLFGNIFFYKSLHSKSLGIFCGVVLKSYWNLVSEGYCKLKMVLSGSSVLGAIILMKKLKSRKFTKLQHSLENITLLLD